MTTKLDILSMYEWSSQVGAHKPSLWSTSLLKENTSAELRIWTLVKVLQYPRSTLTCHQQDVPQT